MAIIVLEDQMLQADFLHKILINYCQTNNKNSEKILIHSNESRFLASVIDNPGFNLYFIDIQIKQDLYAGFELAKKIRESDQASLLVFVTSHSELVMKSYKYFVSALTFIEKQVDFQTFKKDIYRVLDTYYQQIPQKKAQEKIEYRMYQTKTSLLKVAVEDILYFESVFDHRVELHEVNQIRIFYGVLNEIEKSDKLLWRIHHSFLVNPLKILAIDKSQKCALLEGGERIPIARSKYKKILTNFEMLQRGEEND